MPTRRIGVQITKGGSGKTTTAIHLAQGLAEKGFKVLAVDTDPQGSFGIFLNADPMFGLGEYALSVLQNKRDIAFEDAIYTVQSKSNKSYDLLVGSGMITKLSREINQATFGLEQQLSNVLDEVDRAYDYVIVDTSPSEGNLNTNVLQYIQEIVVPVMLKFGTIASLTGFFDTYQKFKQFKERSNQTLEASYILPTFMDNRVEESQQVLDYLKEYLESYVPEATLLSPIPYDSKISKSVGWKKSVFDYAPKSNGSVAYRTFVDEVVSGKLKKKHHRLLEKTNAKAAGNEN